MVIFVLDARFTAELFIPILRSYFLSDKAYTVSKPKVQKIVASQQNSKTKLFMFPSLAAQGIKTANPQHKDKINCGYLNHLFAEG